ncbi:DUF4302 domain-containing protein [Labilibacter marinus]|uniref:DUF4302 domain-containing protein n=1 Tax=Labilibacter marinus TaxID=1477105 RepID=UPI00083375A1|nr:DUF4302 domain-containing protein [Labilibacter marinus]
MKKNIYLALVSFVLSVVAISCNDDADMLFEETASERKIEALEQFTEALNASEQGWIFQYFPDDNQKYGGYTYVVDFDENDSVSVWFEAVTDLNTSQESLYDVKSYGGPVLTFNTYNGFMHYFATPSSAEYNAKGGDYEFLLISDSDDMIQLRGTKTGNNMQLIKLNEPPQAYLTKVKTNVNYLSKGSFVANIAGQEISVFEANRNFSFSYEEDEEIVSVKIPYIITDTGVSFYEEVEILGESVKDFTLDMENKKLISTTGDMYFDIVIPPIDLKEKAWVLNVAIAENRSDVILSNWEQIYANNEAQWGEQLSPVMIIGEASASRSEYGISFFSFPGPYRSHYNLGFNGVNGQPDYIDIVKVSEGFNWRWYKHLVGMVDVIADNSPYEVEIDDVNNPTQVKLVSVNNPDVWFVLNE